MTELFRILKMSFQVIFSILNKEKYLSKHLKIHKGKQTSFSGTSELQMFFPYFRPPCLCPSEGHQHGVSILSSINLCGTFCQITRVRNTTRT